MLGLLSTFSPPTARAGIGTAPGGTVNDRDLQERSNTLRSNGDNGFDAAFAKGDQGRSDMSGELKRPPVEGTPIRGESASAASAELDREQAEPPDPPYDGGEEGTFDAIRQAQLDSDHADDEQGDPTAYAPVSSKWSEPTLQPTLPGSGQNEGASTIDPDTGAERDPAQDATDPLSVHLNGKSSSDPARAASDDAYKTRVAGPSVDGLRVQSALMAGSGAVERGATLPHGEDAPFQQAFVGGDHTVPLESADPLRNGQIEGAAFTGAGGITTGIATGETTSKAASFSERYSVANDAGSRVAVVSTADMMRHSAPLPPEPKVASFAANLDKSEDSGRSIVMLAEPDISADVRPLSAPPTELRASLVAGGASTPHMARHVAIQLSDAAGKAADKAIDVTLSPSELGRVRITLTPGDGGMVVSVNAERPETLDLMRRHVDVLDQEFRDLGYGATDFTFSKEEGGAGQAETNGPGDTSDPDDASKPDAEYSPSRMTSLIVTDRLDIRL